MPGARTASRRMPRNTKAGLPSSQAWSVPSEAEEAPVASARVTCTLSSDASAENFKYAKRAEVTRRDAAPEEGAKPMSVPDRATKGPFVLTS